MTSYAWLRRFIFGNMWAATLTDVFIRVLKSSLWKPKKLSGNKMYSSYSIIWRMGSREQLNGNPRFVGWREARPRVTPQITTRTSWFINNVSTLSASQSIPRPSARTICQVALHCSGHNLSKEALYQLSISHYSHYLALVQMKSRYKRGESIKGCLQIKFLKAKVLLYIFLIANIY